MFATNPSGPEVNIISPSQTQTAEQRTARHLRMCEEMAELGMDLARAAARQAAREAAALEAAAQHPQSGLPTPAQTRPHKTTDPATLFTRLCSAVRQAIALEAKLANLPAPGRRSSLAAPPIDDPRRAILRQVFHHVTERNPNRQAIRRQTSERLDEELALDPEGNTHVGDLFTKICEDLAVEIDLATLPDALLDLLCPDDPNAPPSDLSQWIPGFQPNSAAPPQPAQEAKAA